jgi:hypothetical protein
VSEKRRIAELTLEPGASVALVASAHGVNANQVFKWRRALKRGELNEPEVVPTTLLPVMLSAPSVTADAPGQVDAKEQPAAGGADLPPPEFLHFGIRFGRRMGTGQGERQLEVEGQPRFSKSQIQSWTDPIR